MLCPGAMTCGGNCGEAVSAVKTFETEAYARGDQVCVLHIRAVFFLPVHMTLMYDTINEMLAPRHIIIHEMVAKWSHLEGTGHRHTIFFIIGSQLSLIHI